MCVCVCVCLEMSTTLWRSSLIGPLHHKYTRMYIKVKCSRYRPGVAQRVGRGIALLFHDRGTRRGWVVSSTHWPHFTPGKDPVLILQEAGWAPGPVWTGEKSRPHLDSIADRPARSQSLYRRYSPVVQHKFSRALEPKDTNSHLRRFVSVNLPLFQSHTSI